MDLIVRNARLMRRDGLWDIGIAGERIAAVERKIAAGAAEIDAGASVSASS